MAVNGVCLTATQVHSHGFCADVMHETLNRSSLAALQIGSQVNLERAMAADGRFGGHIVAGHVDGLGRISQVAKDDNAIWYTIKAAPDILRYIVEKGSVAIDGISLTVARVSEDSFAISAIPHTVRVTTLCQKGPGDPVNLETDIIGKYVERLLGLSEGKVRDASVGAARELSAPSGRFGREEAASGKPGGGLTMDFLRECGI